MLQENDNNETEDDSSVMIMIVVMMMMMMLKILVIMTPVRNYDYEINAVGSIYSLCDTDVAYNKYYREGRET